MACQFLPCRCCDRLIRSTSVVVTGTAPNQVLTITIPTTDFVNLENYCLVIAQSLPTESNVLPVVISNGTDTIPVMCRKGNTIRADQVRTRCRYSITYGNDPVHIMVNNCVGRTGYNVE